MENQIYGLQYELEQRDSVLVFTREQALNENDLVSLERKMMLNYPIAKLLPLQIIEVDLHIKLVYKLESKLSLSQIASQGKINESDCVRIIYAIVSTINDSKLHLLNEERYLLQEQFIYLGADYTDVRLVYLPMQTLPGKAVLQEDLFLLITRLLKKAENKLSPGEAGILHFLKSPSFRLSEFKEILIRIMAEAEPMKLVNQDQVKPSLIKLVHKQISIETNKITLQNFYSRFKKQLNGSTILTKYNPFLVVANIFFFIIVWSFYLFLPSSGMFNLCLGASLLISNMSVQLNRTIGTMDTDELIQRKKQGVSSSLNMPLNAEEQLNYYEQLSDQTTLLVPQDATILLPPPVKAYLELNLGDINERINITGDTFIIGRNPDVVHYKVDWIGVSRTHLEIKREGKEYEAKDLDSKNGSFINDKLMIPHKSYSLVEGDCLKIVEKQFVYKKYS